VTISGRLDRQIVIESPAVAQDASGEPVETYSTFATVWARKLSIKRAAEAFKFEQRVGTKNVVWEIRHRTDLTNRMRVLFDGVYYDIVGIEEIERAKGLLLHTEAVLA